jgi:hypothetical protein
MLSSTYDPDSKKLTDSVNSHLDDIQVQLNSIKAVQNQIDFLNNKEVLPDFELFFKVRVRRFPI